ncbi:MAG: hypothetical protein HY956_05550 [Deltaproteobacteria bacterium]|nr:hypothetical protein [Deltaproteobacteria bacterium]
MKENEERLVKVYSPPFYKEGAGEVVFYFTPPNLPLLRGGEKQITPPFLEKRGKIREPPSYPCE